MSDILTTYWSSLFGTSAEAQALVGYLAEDVENAEGVIEVHKIFADLGLDGLSGNYTDTELDGYGDAFLVVAALAVLMAENKAQGAVQLAEVGGEAAAKEIRLHTEPKENTQINTALKYFALSPEDHAAAERFDEDELSEFADLNEQLRGQLD